MRLFWNKTEFKAGGMLGVGHLPLLSTTPLLEGEPRTPPPFLDHRGECTFAEDQGSSPCCAAVSMTALIENAIWKQTNIPAALDYLALYAEAKRIDGNSTPGTYLTSVVQAAKNLGHITAESPVFPLSTSDDCMMAMHSFGGCLLGFMINDGWNYCSARTGWIPEGSQTLGGHAVYGIWGSFQDDSRGIGFQNSWDHDKWGCKGFGRLTLDQFDSQFIGGLAVDVRLTDSWARRGRRVAYG